MIRIKCRPCRAGGLVVDFASSEMIECPKCEGEGDHLPHIILEWQPTFHDPPRSVRKADMSEMCKSLGVPYNFLLKTVPWMDPGVKQP